MTMPRLALLSLGLFLCGCMANKPRNPAATQPVTNVDPATATPGYWLQRPPTAEVQASSLDRLFEICEQVAREHLFPIDRRDYRETLLITEPVVSKQWFELWRKDAGSARDVRENSIAPIRRTIHFEFDQNADGTWRVAPKVLVERYSKVESKYVIRDDQLSSYWYALRRDTVLEEKLAVAIRKHLGA